MRTEKCVNQQNRLLKSCLRSLITKRLVGTSFLLAPSAYRNEVRNARHYAACSIGCSAEAESQIVELAVRVVAITDVYDALLSKRAYKEAWSKEDVLQYLHVNAGKQFDPEMLEVFFGIQNIMDSIWKKYSY